MLSLKGLAGRPVIDQADGNGSPGPPGSAYGVPGRDSMPRVAATLSVAPQGQERDRGETN